MATQKTTHNIDDTAMARLGREYVRTGDDVGAASALRTAAWLEPTLVPAHLALADTYLRLGQPALAVQAIEAGLRSLPESAELKQKLLDIKGSR